MSILSLILKLLKACKSRKPKWTVKSLFATLLFCFPCLISLFFTSASVHSSCLNLLFLPQFAPIDFAGKSSSTWVAMLGFQLLVVDFVSVCLRRMVLIFRIRWLWWSSHYNWCDLRCWKAKRFQYLWWRRLCSALLFVESEIKTAH